MLESGRACSRLLRRDRPHNMPGRPAAPVPLVLVPKGFDTKLNMFNAQVTVLDRVHDPYQRVTSSRSLAAMWAPLFDRVDSALASTTHCC